MKKLALAALLVAVFVCPVIAGEVPIGPAPPPPPPACTENCTQSTTQTATMLPLIVIELLIKLRP
jgi:hypothetical protein